MFKDYCGKPVVRSALEVTLEMNIEPIDASTSCIHLVGPCTDRVIAFKHYEPVKVGDYIVELTDTDIYHCSRSVFLERNIVTGVNDTDTPKHPVTFGEALEWLKAGSKATKASWNDPDRFVYVVPQNLYYDVTNNSGLAVGGLVQYSSYFAMVDPINDVVTVWAPAAEDALANDWLIIHRDSK